jgi:uncharacterized membrane protein YkvA (DUF1232 family)
VTLHELWAAAWPMIVGAAAGIAVLWLLLVVALMRTNSGTMPVTDVLRLLPDVVRLVRRLAGDPTLPRGIRIRLTLLLIYLAAPIDVIPDFIPVIGYADDVLVVALVLRSVTRRAGAHALARHWPGTLEGLAAVHHIAQPRTHRRA